MISNPAAMASLDYGAFDCVKNASGNWQVTRVSANKKIGAAFPTKKECEAGLQTSRENRSPSVCTPMPTDKEHYQFFDLETGDVESIAFKQCLLSKGGKEILHQPDPPPSTTGTGNGMKAPAASAIAPEHSE